MEQLGIRMRSLECREFREGDEAVVVGVDGVEQLARIRAVRPIATGAGIGPGGVLGMDGGGETRHQQGGEQGAVAHKYPLPSQDGVGGRRRPREV